MRIRTRKGKDTKIPLLSLLIVAVVALTIGYSAASSTLKINGTAQVTGMSWKIEFQNLSEATLTGNAQKISDPVISVDKTEISSYNVNFLDPGDSISYTFQVANNGTINAKLSEILKDTITCEGFGSDEQAAKDASNVCANIEYTLKYTNEEEHFDNNGSSKNFSNDIEVNDLLNPGDVKNLILTLRYKSPVDGMTIEEPEDDVIISGLGIKLIYSQVKTPTVKPSNPDTPVISTSFAEDTWETIAENVKNGNTSNYHVGDTKIVSIKNYGLHTVRIANMSTPDECKTEGFSQTACGFVVEFTDVVTKYYMNASGEYKGTTYDNGWNLDGWPASQMYSFLNDETNADSFINLLPTSLRKVIGETYSVSGHGSKDENNFVSNDKIYFLSTKEIWKNGSANTISTDSAWNDTRQLDYYKNIGVTTDNYAAAIKSFEGTNTWWWLRTAASNYHSAFFTVNPTGGHIGNNASYSLGVSPAFRIPGETQDTPDTPSEPISFAKDSWATIANAVKTGNTDKYNVGDTKEIATSKFGTQTLRLVNKSTPDECKQSNFSQTACGFVVEFDNILENKQLNSVNNTVLRWSEMDLSYYLNNEFYYTLPEDLKKYIATTDLVDYSELALDKKNVYKSRIYIASFIEKAGDDLKDSVDESDSSLALFTFDDFNLTRPFDYYYEKKQDGTLDSSKSFNGVEKAPYWIRSRFFVGTSLFAIGGTADLGKLESEDATSEYGIIPAFRITGEENIDTTTEISGFNKDSWDVIASNVKTGKTDNYHIGDHKLATLSDGTQVLAKIVNLSRPKKCNGDDFSQTACGFVVGFDKILYQSTMNDTNTYEGGWPNAKLRKTLNNDTFSKLPADLQSVITNTKTVSYKNRDTDEKYISTDKLYLASYVEYNSGYAEDSYLKMDDYGLTRQLDYYNAILNGQYASSALERNYDGKKVKYWTRTITKDSGFTTVGTSDTSSSDTNPSYGVMPYFRLEGLASDESSESKSFAEDSWETIAENVKAGNTSNYHVGDTKKIFLKEFKTNNTVKIVNMSTPSECKAGAFSQSACGFVLEISNIFTKMAMNSTDTVSGGWSTTKLRESLNSFMPIILPSDLVSAITDTRIVSHLNNYGSLYTLNDKFYLPSALEYMSSSGIEDATLKSFDDYGFTRQLDYYKAAAAAGTLNELLKRSFEENTDAPYWTRSVVNNTSFHYFGTATSGANAASELGLVTLFRLEGPDDNIEGYSSFANDDWKTIAENVKSGNTSNYHVGDTKLIDIPGLGSRLVRIVNKSTPSECKQNGFSQTACGFVVEMPDILSNVGINTENTVVGGWQGSHINTYMNLNLPEFLPKDMTSVVTDTNIISYDDRNIGSLYTSTDKYYIPSVLEYIPTNRYTEDVLNQFDDYGKTRQLDYYKMLSDAGTLDEALKRSFEGNNDAPYWTRSVVNNTNFHYFGTAASGVDATSELGLVTLFRLEGPDDYKATPSSFANDPWTTIAQAVKTGNTNNYHVGDTKKITFSGISGEYTAKIVNMSTPSECKQNGFSQTACGFVVEMPSIFANLAMNSIDTVTGGWPATDLRMSLNEGMTQVLPTDLISLVSDTNIISYDDRNIGSLYTSTDKYYIPSVLEYIPTNRYTEDVLNQFDDYGKTRQLDYYKMLSDAGTLDEALKRSFEGNNDAPYWTRSVVNNTSFHYFGTATSGTNATSELGFTTLFRLEGPDDYKETPSSFANDPWTTIAQAVKTGNTSNYHVGDTKKITFSGTGEEYTVKIVNMSTPSECKQYGFSQTACGFVLEISNVFTKIAMNLTDTVTGGWPASSLRNKLNKRMIEVLPTDLISLVSDTNIISYDDRNIGSLYTSTDKYYIPSVLEYIPTNRYTEDVLNQFDDYGKTRQLDYYKMLSDAGTLDEALKRSFEGNNDAPYWTRSVVNNTSFHYFGTATSGTNATSELGFTTLFRLEGPDDYKGTLPTFKDESWTTIAENVKTGNTGYYHIGDTKEVDLGKYGIHKVRIANKSTPSECKQNGFSQSACGFVVEFVDAITTHNINSSANKGGWPKSQMKSFIDNDIYNSLPEELKNVIIDTKTVSGHGKEDVSNFTSIDKLYLLAPKEIYSDWSGQYDMAKDRTRQLDYYKDKGVTTSNCTGAIKNINTSKASWWLRTAVFSTSNNFYEVSINGKLISVYVDNTDDVSPAFRIG